MVLIMGVAGAGKSLQGKILAEKLGYKWLSTGELLRKSISGSRKQDMLNGKLLDDNELIAIIDKTLPEVDSRYIILDGFPRTMPQAEWLLARHESGSIKLDKVILLEVPKASVKKRLLKRGRQDDNEPSINKRFEEHDKMALPIIDLYKNHGVNVAVIDGDKPIEEVSAAIADLFGGSVHADQSQN